MLTPTAPTATRPVTTANTAPTTTKETTMTSNYRDQLKGREQALYDDLQAVLRAHGYDDNLAKTLINTLRDDDAP